MDIIDSPKRDIFIVYDYPKGNADTERVIRTIKEDLVRPREWHSVQQLCVPRLGESGSSTATTHVRPSAIRPHTNSRQHLRPNRQPQRPGKSPPDSREGTTRL